MPSSVEPDRMLNTSVLYAIEQLYLSSTRPNGGDQSNKQYATLLTTLADWFHAYQLQQTRLETAIRAERAWRKSLELRVHTLEARHQASSVQLSNPPTQATQVTQAAQVEQVKQVVQPPVATKPSLLETPPHLRKRKRTCDASEVVDNTVKPCVNGNDDDSGVVDQALPKLPTLTQVKRGLEERRREKRKKKELLPLPCGKCKLRKRALMMRKYGFVKEEMFERWVKTPGNCIEYMHMDEVVENGNCDEDWFEESQTQSPKIGVS